MNNTKTTKPHQSLSKVKKQYDSQKMSNSDISNIIEEINKLVRTSPNVTSDLKEFENDDRSIEEILKEVEILTERSNKSFEKLSLSSSSRHTLTNVSSKSKSNSINYQNDSENNEDSIKSQIETYNSSESQTIEEKFSSKSQTENFSSKSQTNEDNHSTKSQTIEDNQSLKSQTNDYVDDFEDDASSCKSKSSELSAEFFSFVKSSDTSHKYESAEIDTQNGSERTNSRTTAVEEIINEPLNEKVQDNSYHQIGNPSLKPCPTPTPTPRNFEIEKMYYLEKEIFERDRIISEYTKDNEKLRNEFKKLKNYFVLNNKKFTMTRNCLLYCCLTIFIFVVNGQQINIKDPDPLLYYDPTRLIYYKPLRTEYLDQLVNPQRKEKILTKDDSVFQKLESTIQPQLSSATNGSSKNPSVNEINSNSSDINNNPTQLNKDSLQFNKELSQSNNSQSTKEDVLFTSLPLPVDNQKEITPLLDNENDLNKDEAISTESSIEIIKDDVEVFNSSSLAPSYRILYNDVQVWRLPISRSAVFGALNQLSEDKEIAWWGGNVSYADMMVKPTSRERVKALLKDANIPYQVIILDLQNAIDNENPIEDISQELANRKDKRMKNNKWKLKRWGALMGFNSFGPQMEFWPAANWGISVCNLFEIVLNQIGIFGFS